MASINARTQKYCYNYITFIFMNMYENIRNKINIAEKLRVCTNNITNMSVFITLENKASYQINAKTQHIHPIISYENYLICKFMIINENFISNQRKIAQKLMGCIFKTMCISAAYYTKVPIFVPK